MTTKAIVRPFPRMKKTNIRWGVHITNLANSIRLFISGYTNLVYSLLNAPPQVIYPWSVGWLIAVHVAGRIGMEWGKVIEINI